MMRGTATNVVKVYPATGATINGAGANAALEMTAATEVMTCVGMSANAWQCVRYGGGVVISSRRRLSDTSSDSTDEVSVIGVGSGSLSSGSEVMLAMKRMEQRMQASLSAHAETVVAMNAKTDSLSNGLLLALGGNGVLIVIIALLLMRKKTN